MDENYWVDYWKKRGKNSAGEDSQTRILRTKNKHPITQEHWQLLLSYIDQMFPVNSDSVLLDVCAGNGLFSRHFADRGAIVTATDISADLLSELDELSYSKIQTRCEDMRTLNFSEAQFSHVFLYSGIQYVSDSEAVRLLRQCYRWLKPGGRLVIGDIPDAALRWEFYKSESHRIDYFNNLAKGIENIGTWYERDWFQFLAEDAGFQQVELRAQPTDQIYSHFRFDAFLVK